MTKRNVVMGFDLVNGRTPVNWDISTEEGMRNAMAWQTNMVALVADGGRWLVPRSGSIYEINKSTKTARLCMQMFPDPSIVKVFRAMGWKVVNYDGSDIDLGEGEQ